MRDPSSIARPSLSQCPRVVVRTVKVLCRSVFLACNKGDSVECLFLHPALLSRESRCVVAIGPVGSSGSVEAVS